MPNVTMPKLSDSMEEATIVAWLVQDGATVTVGQELAEVETDKATTTFEAEAEGSLKILVPAGETVALGAVIAQIVGDGEVLSAPSSRSAPTAVAAVVDNDVASPGPRPTSQPRRIASSPVARRLATRLKIDLASIDGTGPSGRIVKADVEAAAQASSNTLTPEPAAAATNGGRSATEARVPPAAGAKGSSEVFELSRTRQVIARRMAESRAVIPDFDVEVEVDMEATWALREEIKTAALEGRPPSVNDFVVMACARALRELPAANSAYRDASVEQFSRINVGVAVASEDALVVPTVFDADTRSLGDIARTTRALAKKVREGTITPPELAGATFTVSNLGMFGVDRFTAVINAPQVAILAVGAVRQRAVVRHGEVQARRTMTMTLAADHRVLYGADAARLLARMQELLEHPLTLVAG